MADLSAGKVQEIAVIADFLMTTATPLLTILGVIVIFKAVFEARGLVTPEGEPVASGFRSFFSSLLPGVFILIMASVLPNILGLVEESSGEAPMTVHSLESLSGPSSSKPEMLSESGRDASLTCNVGDTVTFMGEDAIIESKDQDGWLDIKNKYGETRVVSRSELSCQ